MSKHEYREGVERERALLDEIAPEPAALPRRRDRPLSYSLRGLSRATGGRFGRAFLAAEVHAGRLPAVAHGNSLVVLASDFVAWCRAHAVRPDAHAERVVERRLAREGRSARP